MELTIATRQSYGEALKDLGRTRQDVIVLDADLAGATKTDLFKKAYPDRHIDCGIAEGNMMTIAAGLSTTGLVPFASTFAIFAAGRAYEQIRNSIGYPHLNVKVAATHAGVTVGEDGASHQAIEDIALMREIPGMTVICPCDDTQAKAAVKAAADYEGPVYLRFSRAASPVIYNPFDYHFEIGKGHLLRSGIHVTIIATGYETAQALEAAHLLFLNGIEAEVIDLPTIKPLDEEIILNSAGKTGLVVTCEEHSIHGGLGSAVAELLSEKLPTRMKRIGIQDVFGQSGTAEELIRAYGLDANTITETVMSLVWGENQAEAVKAGLYSGLRN